MFRCLCFCEVDICSIFLHSSIGVSSTIAIAGIYVPIAIDTIFTIIVIVTMTATMTATVIVTINQFLPHNPQHLKFPRLLTYLTNSLIFNFRW